ncbi:MAG: secreted protein [Frankiales bacterium]|nr:secreted protein [Frankiales bacterium]
MLLSLGVIFLFIALGWPAFVNRETTTVRAIDFHQALTAARRTAGFPLLSPEGLREGWRATSARSNAAATPGFHIGLVTPADQYAEVEQTTAAEADAVRAFLGADSVPGEMAKVGGVDWQLRETRKHEHALVRTANGSTIVVTGTADWPELQELAAALR